MASVGRFSVFEATANQDIARTIVRLSKLGWFEYTANGYPWTEARLTDKGTRALREVDGMTVVRFKARLADGRVVRGPIQGIGGKLGSSSLHAGYEHASAAATGALTRAVRRAMANEPTLIYEPEPGCVAMCPDYGADGDGEPAIVPLLGTSWSACAEPREKDEVL